VPERKAQREKKKQKDQNGLQRREVLSWKSLKAMSDMNSIVGNGDEDGGVLDRAETKKKVGDTIEGLVDEGRKVDGRKVR
jgi:hypothetical protein